MKYLNFFLKYFIVILSSFIVGLLIALILTYFELQIFIIVIIILALIFIKRAGKYD